MLVGELNHHGSPENAMGAEPSHKAPTQASSACDGRPGSQDSTAAADATKETMPMSRSWSPCQDPGNSADAVSDFQDAAVAGGATSPGSRSSCSTAPMRSSNRSQASSGAQEQLLVRSLTEETATSFGDDSLSFEIHELLGQGGFGSVYRCSLTKSDGQLTLGQEFAVKVVDAQRIAMLVGAPIEAVVPRLLREAEVKHMLGRHPHIVDMHGAFFSNFSNKIYLVFEYVRGGDLFELLVRRRKPLGEAEARVVIAQLAEAVNFGHRRGIAHRDLKMENCLISDIDNLGVKLCDYGQAAILGMDKTSKTLTSTMVYTAPDVHAAVQAGDTYDAFKADSFAVGVLMYGILCNAMPKSHTGAGYTSHKMWPALSENARDLIQKLLVPDADKRIAVADILNHPWLPDSTAPKAVPDVPFSLEDLPSEKGLELFLTAHQLVVALQRERGVCLWAHKSSRFHWHLKYTDKRFDDALLLLHGGHCQGLGESLWRFEEVLTWARTKTEAVRASVAADLDCQDKVRTPVERSGLIDGVVSAYSAVISALMRAIAMLMPSVTGGGSARETRSFRLRLLMLTAEQLGCERALLCGHLHDPKGLRDPHVSCRISQVIGARKLLLGSCGVGAAFCTGGTTPPAPPDGRAINEPFAWAAAPGGHGIVAGMQGLFPALGLTDEPLLDFAQLKRLENAEDTALGLTSKAAPELSYWYWLLTKLIDKIHEHVAHNVLEHFHL